MAKGIYKRGKIYWIRYAGLDGRTVFESSGSTKFDKAQSLYFERKKAIGDGNQPEIKKIANYTFRELSEKYLLWITGRQNSAKVKGYIIGQLVTIFGSLPLRRFNTAIVEQLQTDLINRKMKNSSINKVLNVLKHMFSKAVEWDMVETETLKRIRRVKLLRDDSRRLRFLSKEEAQVLVSSSENHLKPIIITALNTGMRKGELLGLTWDRVDLKHGFILLDKTKNGDRREIPINNTLRSVLQGLTRRIDIPSLFFDQATGRPYSDVKRSFHTALKRVEYLKCPDCDYQKPRVKSKEVAGDCPLCGARLAVLRGIQDFHFHDLRHTFASHLVMAGVDITTVKELLGHKTLTMTLRYAHLAPSHKVKAVDLLNETLNGKPTVQKLYKEKGLQDAVPL